MKTITAISILGMLLLSTALPVAWAAEGEDAGTPAEFKDLQKTLKQDRIDNLERRVSDLERSNRFLADRMQDLERTVFDYKSRQ
jgi:uncharacterized membrane protein YgcG